jgi:mRNA-degrading endonuclease RelE of RelBE toxin-antitoxin system
MYQVIYHRLVQKDIHSALDYYDREGGSKLGDQFFFGNSVSGYRYRKEPLRHHFSDGELRRSSLKSFPYHILYEVDDAVIWVAVLRHDRRRPSFGLRRKKGDNKRKEGNA